MWPNYFPQNSRNNILTCVLDMSGFKTVVKLNVLPVGSYDILIGMDWLEQHRVVLNCFDKTFPV